MPMAFRIAAIALVLSSAPAVAQPRADTLQRIAGAWEVVSETSRSGCENGQVFRPSPDGRYVDLTHLEAEDVPPTRYIVLDVQADRILMFIEGEGRLTATGDPVIWWAVFSGNDSFRWRRYDWPATALTSAEWRRCTT